MYNRDFILYILIHIKINIIFKDKRKNDCDNNKR